MSYLLGIDIGGTSVKLSLIEEDGKFVHLEIQKVTSNVKAALNSLTTALRKQYNLKDIGAAGITSSAKELIPKEFKWTECGSSLAIASGLLHNHPDAKTDLPPIAIPVVSLLL
jgi:activator of 2-hydroxyglutaryl-CoA dehydratase